MAKDYPVGSVSSKVADSDQQYGTQTAGVTADGDSSTVYATATPNSGCKFAGWTYTYDGTGDLSSLDSLLHLSSWTWDNSPVEGVEAGHLVLIAHFIGPNGETDSEDPVYYTVTTTPNDSKMGSTKGGGVFKKGASCTIEATPNSGYEFFCWTCDSGETKTNPYTFTVSQDRNFTAIFTKHYDVIKVTTKVASGSGTTSGDGYYYYGRAFTVSATPASGYKFVKWTCSNGAEFFTQEVDYTAGTSDLTFTATFAEETDEDVFFTIDVSTDGNGSADGGGVYNRNQTYTLTATPSDEDKYEFDHWEYDGGSTSTSNPLVGTATKDMSYTAVFKSHYIKITVEVAECDDGTIGGTTTGSGTYHYGDKYTVESTPKVGYEFDHWDVSSPSSEFNDSATEDSPNLFRTAKYDVRYVAHFKTAENFVNVTVGVASGVGTVAGGGRYEEGTTYIVSATPGAGHVFGHWTSSDGVEYTTEDVSDVAVLGHDMSYMAVFYPCYSSDDSEGDGEKDIGRGRLVIADGLAGRFADDVEGYRRTVELESSSWNGNEVTFTANASVYTGQDPINIEFDHWESTRGFRSTEERISDTLTIAENEVVTYTAVFNVLKDDYGLAVCLRSISRAPLESDSPNVSFTQWGSKIGVINVNGEEKYSLYSGRFRPGDKISISVSSIDATYNAVGAWFFNDGSYYDGSHIGTDSKDIVMPERNLTAVVYLYNRGKTLTLVADGNGTVSGGGGFVPGTEFNIEAVPDDGNVFVEWWGDDGSSYKDAKTTGVMPDSDLVLTARFIPAPEEDDDGNLLYTVSSAGIDGSGSGTNVANVGGTGKYKAGDDVTIYVTPRSGCSVVMIYGTAGVRGFLGNADSVKFKMPEDNVELVVVCGYSSVKISTDVRYVLLGNSNWSSSLGTYVYETIDVEEGGGYVSGGLDSENGPVEVKFGETVEARVVPTVGQLRFIGTSSHRGYVPESENLVWNKTDGSSVKTAWGWVFPGQSDFKAGVPTWCDDIYNTNPIMFMANGSYKKLYPSYAEYLDGWFLCMNNGGSNEYSIRVYLYGSGAGAGYATLSFRPTDDSEDVEVTTTGQGTYQNGLLVPISVSVPCTHQVLLEYLVCDGAIKEHLWENSRARRSVSDYARLLYGGSEYVVEYKVSKMPNGILCESNEPYDVLHGKNLEIVCNDSDT